MTGVCVANEFESCGDQAWSSVCPIRNGHYLGMIATHQMTLQNAKRPQVGTKGGFFCSGVWLNWKCLKVFLFLHQRKESFEIRSITWNGCGSNLTLGGYHPKIISGFDPRPPKHPFCCRLLPPPLRVLTRCVRKWCFVIALKCLES